MVRAIVGNGLNSFIVMLKVEVLSNQVRTQLLQLRAGSRVWQIPTNGRICPRTDAANGHGDLFITPKMTMKRSKNSSNTKLLYLRALCRGCQNTSNGAV